MIESVTVFCGSSLGASPRYEAAVRDFGALLAGAGIRAVYGGGRSGLMGALADAALAAGGEVVGIIPSFLHRREVAHDGLTEIHVVSSMHERKQLMFDLSDAACALPGGPGTLDETIEFVTWRQLGLHDRAMVILDTDGYWDGLRALMERIVDHGFAGPGVHDYLRIHGNPGTGRRRPLPRHPPDPPRGRRAALGGGEFSRLSGLTLPRPLPQAGGEKARRSRRASPPLPRGFLCEIGSAGHWGKFSALGDADGAEFAATVGQSCV